MVVTDDCCISCVCLPVNAESHCSCLLVLSVCFVCCNSVVVFLHFTEYCQLKLLVITTAVSFACAWPGPVYGEVSFKFINWCIPIGKFLSVVLNGLSEWHTVTLYRCENNHLMLTFFMALEP